MVLITNWSSGCEFLILFDLCFYFSAKREIAPAVSCHLFEEQRESYAVKAHLRLSRKGLK